MDLVNSLYVCYEMHFCTKVFIMLDTEDFGMCHCVGFSQIGSHMCVRVCMYVCMFVCVYVCTRE